MLQSAFAAFFLLGTSFQGSEPDGYVLKSKETLTGTARAIEGDWVVLELAIMDGSATVRRKLADFTPASEFRIRMQVMPPKTFEEHFAMARTALRLGIVAQAGEHAGLARALSDKDSTGEQRQELDGWAAAALHGLFDKAIAESDVVEARHYLKLMATRVPKQFDEAQMGKLFDTLADMETRLRTAVVEVTAVKEASERRSEFQKLCAPVLKQIELADAQVKDGLRNSRTTVQATRNYDQAIVHYKAAWRSLDLLLKKRDKDPEAQEVGARLAQRIKDSGVQAALHAGNALTVQGDYRSALEWANKALSLDPSNGDAKALIHTIQIAQAAGGAWGGWGR